MTIIYRLEPELTPEEFIDVLRRSTLAERRPVDDLDTIRAMLKNADAIVTARLDGLLVGVSRAITDFAYCTYLSDLAVDEKHQRQGIGRELIRCIHEAAPLPQRGCVSVSGAPDATPLGLEGLCTKSRRAAVM